MLLKKDIHKTKHFFHKTLRNLMSLLFRRYQKLPKAPRPNPFSHSKNYPKTQQLNDLYRDLSEQWESDHDEAMEIKKKCTVTMKEATRKENAAQSDVKSTKKEREKGESKRGSYRELGKGDGSSRSGRVLAQKMKELEMMMNVNDVDHVMDIEEALYLYSRLTCPVYLDLLDKFFMDMYSEFFLPKPSLSVNNSMRRLGPVKL